MDDYIVTLVRAFSNLNKGYNYLTGGSLTPQKPVEYILNTLPEDIWHNKDCTFLLPSEDYGWVLFEIYNKYMKGLKDIIPNVKERIKNIYSRITIIPKTLDIDKDIYAKNILTRWFKTFNIENCVKLLDKEFLLLDTNMKFDVIIGNPPYQQNYGNSGKNNANAKSIYNLFIDKAISFKPKYICMITPSRWMTKSAQSMPSSWVDSMLKCNHFRIIHDYEKASEIFSDVEIKGGVSYFLWDRDYNGDCEYYFHESGNKAPIIRKGKLDYFNIGMIVRNPKSYSIIQKIQYVEGKYYQDSDKNFSGLVSPRHYFTEKNCLMSNWNEYSNTKTPEYYIKYYMVDSSNKRTSNWISDKQLRRNKASKDMWKVYIPGAFGTGNMNDTFGKPFIGEPGSVCSSTFALIGYNPNKHKFTENECKNIISYIYTKFFRYLVSILKTTQNGSRWVYQFVPMQDFSKPWTDKELYVKYDLNQDEIDFIEKNIKKMT